jgi:hypothetical protein
VFIAFIGYGLNDVIALPSGTSYVGHLATGLLAMLVGSGAVGGGFSLIEDKASGFLRALLVAPVSRTHLVLAKLIARVLVSLAARRGLALLLAAFTPVRLADPVAGAAAVAAITAIFVALGVAIAVPLRRLDSFRLIAAMVTVPLYLCSGSSIPSRRCPRRRAGSPCESAHLRCGSAALRPARGTRVAARALVRRARRAHGRRDRRRRGRVRPGYAGLPLQLGPRSSMK